jgi:MoxR-like ATPase
MTVTRPAPSDVEQLEQLAAAAGRLRAQVARRIVGQEEAVEGILAAILAGGHALLIGVPGLAKTMMVHTVAEALALSFQRVQFTPDLMPSDITGTEIIEEDLTTGKRAFRFVKGPVFANVVLADEINRTPPKTQAALLQAMQEHQVTVAGQTYSLPEPFFVLATQNPSLGHLSLPEAQLDRCVRGAGGYPSWRRRPSSGRPLGGPGAEPSSTAIAAGHAGLVRIPVSQLIRRRSRSAMTGPAGRAGVDPGLRG